jgi:hypothetical protein
MATLSFASCSSDEDLIQDSQAGTKAGAGTTFMALNISMPSTVASRAGEVDEADSSISSQYNYDSEDEYQAGTTELYVYSAPIDATAQTVVIPEDQYTLEDWCTVKLSSNADGYADISSVNSVVAQMSFTPTEDKEYYAFVLINRNGDYIPNPGEEITGSDGSKSYKYATFGQWRNQLIKAATNGMCLDQMVTEKKSDKTFSKFYMANALRKVVIEKDADGSYVEKDVTTETKTAADYRYLAHIDKSKIVNTASAAYTVGTAATIYVERGLAKLSVNTEPLANLTGSLAANNGKSFWMSEDAVKTASSWANIPTINNTSAAFNGSKVAFVGWTPDNVDQSTFLIHMLNYDPNYTTSTVSYTYGITANDFDQMAVGKGSKYFIGGSNRVNWAFTPRYNYSEKGRLADLYTEPYKVDRTDWAGGYPNIPFYNKDQQRYITENCQGYNQMYKSTTTRVIFKAYYLPNGWSTPETVIIYNGQNYTQSEFLALINSNLKDFVPSYEHSEEILGAPRRRASNPEVETAGQRFTLTADNIDLTKIIQKTTYEPTGNTRDAGMFTIDCFKGLDELGNIDEMVNMLNSAMNTSLGNGIQVYIDGVCYYVAYIRHFSDNLTNIQWSGKDSAPDTYTVNNNTVTAPYLQKHLGRYGIVRNHWYEFTITDVTMPGTTYIPKTPDPYIPDPDPDDPTPPDEPDDVLNTFFSCRINVMAWTKHEFNYSL